MYRATLIFSYSFSLSGYYTYFWYPIPLSQLCLGYFLSFSASIPFLPLRPGYFLHFSASIPFFPLRPGIFCTFRPLYPFSRCARVFSALFGLYTLFPAAPWVLYFLHFSASIPFLPLRLRYFLHFPAFHTLAILRFCVCRSLTIHRIA